MKWMRWLVVRIMRSGRIGIVTSPSRAQARPRKADAESSGEDASVEQLCPEWKRHERRNIRRGCNRRNRMID
jgi:hypothetical protein